MKSGKMNILMIMSDSLVVPLSGPYGDQVGSTPNIDRLADSGVVFDRAYCNSPLCVPSRGSMLTGRYASEIECLDNANNFNSDWPTIGHTLGAAGYETVICGKMHLVGHDQLHGFDQHLALDADYTHGYVPGIFKIAYDWKQPSGGNPSGNGWMGQSYVNCERWDHFPQHYDWDQIIHKEALSYLSRKTSHSSPFFCCVSYHAPHNPFWIPEKYKAPFRSKTLPLPDVPDGIDTCHGIMDKWLNDFHYVPQFGKAMMQKENLRWLYETYYGIISCLDTQIGELMTLLKKQGLDKNTAVIFTSDHGDMLAHRGMLQKRYLYERSTRVPLIFSFPDHWRRAARVEDIVSLVDILPTLSEMTGAPLLPDLPGKSILPLITGQGNLPERAVFAEYHGEGVHAPCFMARKGDYKYIYVHGHEEQLYNVTRDPDEYVNLIDETKHRSLVSDFKKAVLTEFDPEEITRFALKSQDMRRFVLKCVKEHDKYHSS